MNKFNLKDMTRIDFRIYNDINNIEKIHIMDINNVSCCNFEYLDDKYTNKYCNHIKEILTGA